MCMWLLVWAEAELQPVDDKIKIMKIRDGGNQQRTAWSLCVLVHVPAAVWMNADSLQISFFLNWRKKKKISSWLFSLECEQNVYTDPAWVCHILKSVL